MLYVNTIVISLRVVEIIENIIDTILNFYLYGLIFSLLHKSLSLKRQKKFRFQLINFEVSSRKFHLHLRYQLTVPSGSIN